MSREEKGLKWPLVAVVLL